MNDAFLIIAIIFAFILVVTALAFFFYYIYRKHGKVDETPQNLPIVLNFTKQLKHFLFIELESNIIDEFGTRNNIVLCRSYRTEIDSDGEIKPPEIALQKQIITTSRGRRVVLPKGDIDIDRDVIFYFDDDLSSADIGFKRTNLYKMIIPLYAEIDSDKTLLHSYSTTKENLLDELNMILASNEPMNEMLMNKIQNMKQMVEDIKNGTEQRES